MHTMHTTCIHICAYTIAYSCTDQIHTHETFMYHTHIYTHSKTHTYIYTIHAHMLSGLGWGYIIQSINSLFIIEMWRNFPDVVRAGAVKEQTARQMAQRRAFATQAHPVNAQWAEGKGWKLWCGGKACSCLCRHPHSDLGSLSWVKVVGWALPLQVAEPTFTPVDQYSNAKQRGKRS